MVLNFIASPKKTESDICWVGVELLIQATSRFRSEKEKTLYGLAILITCKLTEKNARITYVLSCSLQPTAVVLG